MNLIKLIIYLAVTLYVYPVFGVEQPGELEQQLQVDQNISQQLDLSLEFTDHTGKKVRLEELFKGDLPVIITPIYYGCPRLCGLLLNGVISLLQELNLTLGIDYKVVSVSFDTTETHTAAAKKGATILNKLKQKRPESQDSAWSFLVGDEKNVQALMQQIGFKYFREGQDFAHAALIVLATPGGEISQYFFGIEFPAWDVRLSLIEASRGNIGSILDHAMLFCFRFDPLKGRYVWLVNDVLKLGGALTLIGLIWVVYRAARRN